MLVSAGSLRPSLSPDCPNSVRDLVDKCLDSDPANRPSALQLHYELRNLELALDDLAITGRMSNPMPRNNCRAPRRTPHTHRSERGRKPRQWCTSSRTMTLPSCLRSAETTSSIMCDDR